MGKITHFEGVYIWNPLSNQNGGKAPLKLYTPFKNKYDPEY
jgi:hypothetical protein